MSFAINTLEDLEQLVGRDQALKLWAKAYPESNVAKRSKFGNIKTTIDGIKFDSQAEAAFYSTIKLLKRAGEVSKIELQPVFILQEKFTLRGTNYPKITYRADFRITYPDGRIEVVDVKGHQTDVYKLKKKLFLDKFGADYLFVEIYKGTRKEF